MLDIAENALALRPWRILIAIRDPEDRETVVADVESTGTTTVSVFSREELHRQLSLREPDLVLLDMELDDDACRPVLRDVRSRTLVPLILLASEMPDGHDPSIVLDLGADDYLIKPFRRTELVARVRAQLRRRGIDTLRPPPRSSQRFRFDGWEFDQGAHEIINAAGEAVALTNREAGLLSVFLSAPGKPLSRQYLAEATHADGDIVDRSIDVQILRLRRKLETDPSRPRVIQTDRGRGYVFRGHLEPQVGCDRKLDRIG
jgi:two-component system, OmpR family, response regulator